MPLKDRQTLKNLFQNGSMPSQSSFADIIDSSINKIDDGFSKSLDDGLMLSPIGDSKKVLTVFRKITDQSPEWSIELDEETGKDKAGRRLNLVHRDADQATLSLNDKGYVGVHTPNPRYPLEVNGFAAAPGRVGLAAEESTVPADGEWHNILEGLNHCNAYEVVARTGVFRTGKHALMHAIAISAWGNSRSRIKTTQARFSFWRPIRLKLRWVGSSFDYALQIKTTRNLGDDVLIKYYVTQLWSDEEMGIPDQYTKTEE